MKTRNFDRRQFLKTAGLGAAGLAISGCLDSSKLFSKQSIKKRPNILFCIADDWGPKQASILGETFIKTETFDRIARNGVLFTNNFVAAPTCTASRAGILSGQMPHRLGNAMNLSSNWTNIPQLYTDILSANGYHVGFTRKGWGPGKHDGREINPAGNRYKDFSEFLSKRPKGMPFCFWFGSNDPHRSYDPKLAADYKLDASKVSVPVYLPDVPEVRRDLTDYYAEIKRFDIEVGQLIKQLEQINELENTIVVLTGDNGLPFPRSKGNLYDAGTKTPLAISWLAQVPAGRVISDFVSTTDFAPTFLEAAGLNIPKEMTGRSLMNVLLSSKDGSVDSSRDKVFTERERHTWCHPEGRSFPARALRTKDFLYIRNFRPQLFPAGHPFLRRPNGTPKGHLDCDEGPSKYFIIDHKDDPKYSYYYRIAFERRSAEELYDLRKDSGQLNNVAQDSSYAKTLSKMRTELSKWMLRTNDPRAKGETDVWDGSCWYEQVKADVKMPGYETVQPPEESAL